LRDYLGKKARSNVASSVYSRTLQKAAALAGGYAQLCRVLKVPAAELQKWIDDKATPPRGVFLLAVDYILQELPPVAASEPAEPPAPRDCSAGGETLTLL
jgi:hypothetical protein